MGDSIALAKERDRLKPDQMVLFEQPNVGPQVAGFQYDHPALFGFGLSLPLAALSMIDDGAQIVLGVLVIARNGSRAFPDAVEGAGQVIEVVPGHPGADNYDAGVEHEPGAIPAA